MSNEYPSTTRVLQKKPSESAFKQQKLPAWQPILTASTVLPTFFVIGISFIPIGIGILIFSEGVQEKIIDYTQCNSTSSRGRTCADILDNSNQVDCSCNVTFTLDTDFNGDVYMYYGLTNFYQNHRRYVKSRDDVQLLGQLNKKVSDECEPYSYVNDSIPIAPCGAIANSMFNDELSLVYQESQDGIHGMPVPLIKTGIAWPSDKKVKFHNPGGKNLREAFADYAKPINWRKNIWELDLDDESNNGFQNEDFIVWMRTAALPNFRKLYRRIDHTVGPFKNGLPKGTYSLQVKYFYKVVGFGGTKSIILSTTSILGAKNPFLGYAYITVGSLCLMVGVMFLLIHLKYGKSTAEVVNVTPTTSYQ